MSAEPDPREDWREVHVEPELDAAVADAEARAAAIAVEAPAVATPVAAGHEVVPAPRPAEPVYVGLVTRGIGFAIDAAVIDVVALVVAGVASLITSLFPLSPTTKDVLQVIGVAVFVLWAAGYFVAFWTTTGQTPGARVMQFRVVSASGQKLGIRRALVRAVGLVLAALPLFAGYVAIIFNRRRRGFADRLANTVVIEAPATAYLEQRRLRRSAGRRVPSSS